MKTATSLAYWMPPIALAFDRLPRATLAMVTRWACDVQAARRLRGEVAVNDITRLLCTLILTILPTHAFAKPEFDEFKLNVVFINATASTSNADLERNAIIPWVQEAEKQYGTKPRLKITYTVEEKRKLDGKPLADLEFDGMSDFGKFMDDHFDNYARSETDGHLTVLVGNTLCWNNVLGKRKCWGGWSNFPHDVNPLGRKKGIWLSESKDKYVLAHELGHFFSLKHTFEPYVGLNLPCNKEFSNKNIFNPDIGHCNSCTGKITVQEGGTGKEYYICEGGVSNVMDYCSSIVVDRKGNSVLDSSGNWKSGPETLNVCQQERSANQRQQYLTADGKVNYVELAGLRGEGQCSQDSQCKANEFCTTGVLDLTRNVCKEKKAHGATCTDKRQCTSDRCAWGYCADPDECQADTDCAAGNYCGDPISGKRTCKARLNDGALCTKDDQCKAGRCKTGFCSAAASASMGESCRFDDECRVGSCNAAIGGVTQGTCVCKSDGDCGSGKWCNAGLDLKINACRDKLPAGASCGTVGSLGNDHKCRSGSCSGFPKYQCE
jgi:Dickkopf N-terminal cysteine-rich region